MKLTNCTSCRGTHLAPGEVEESRAVGGQTYKGKVGGVVCQDCGASYLASKTMERFEREVVLEVMAQGEPTGEAFAYARKVLGVSAKEVARLLGLTPETISRWETGRMPADIAAFFLLGVMVREAKEGRSTTLDLLRSAHEPRLPATGAILLSPQS